MVNNHMTVISFIDGALPKEFTYYIRIMRIYL